MTGAQIKKVKETTTSRMLNDHKNMQNEKKKMLYEHQICR